MTPKRPAEAILSGFRKTSNRKRTLHIRHIWADSRSSYTLVYAANRLSCDVCARLACVRSLLWRPLPPYPTGCADVPIYARAPDAPVVGRLSPIHKTTLYHTGAGLTYPSLSPEYPHSIPTLSTKECKSARGRGLTPEEPIPSVCSGYPQK